MFYHWQSQQVLHKWGFFTKFLRHDLKFCTVSDLFSNVLTCPQNKKEKKHSTVKERGVCLVAQQDPKTDKSGYKI